MFNNLLIYLINRLRVISKSIGKKEEDLTNIITHLNWKKFNYKLSSKNKKKITLPKNLAITISFYYNKNKIKYLSRTCEGILDISRKYKINILTNETSSKLRKTKVLKSKNILIHNIKNLTNTRLLPWYHIDIMKKKFNNRKYTHFMHLEDDLLISKENILYWLRNREYLKRFNLIPGFILTETNKNNKTFTTSITKKQNLKYLPKFYLNEKDVLLNVNYPYQAMYFYDRTLMKEYLFSNACNPDHGYGALDGNFISPKLIGLDLLAKANIGLTYTNIPKGFLNRVLFPVNIYNKKFDLDCLIKHMPNKYIKDDKTNFSKVDVNKVFK